MEPHLLGLATATAGAVGRAVTPVAQLLATPFASLLQRESLSASAAKPQTIELEGLEARAGQLQEDLENRIQQAINDSGVQLDFPVRLRLSEFDGALEADAVASPEREILEAALASDPSLADDFRQLANGYLEALLVLSETDNQLRLQFE
ncbi:MAG: hypothetical protein GXP28_07210 [Planctomycetes bacterium]|nr:hypothetical protein [Planctomycetota bacterium]